MKTFTFQFVIVASLLLLLVSRDTLTRPGSVHWVWSGAVTEHSAVVKARLNHDTRRVRLAVSESPELRHPRFSGATTADRDGNGRVVSLQITGLEPDTRYFYAVEIDGRIDRAAPGSFRTFPSGPASFRFAFGSCAKTGSEHPVFLAIRDEKPLFFASLGDLHYENIDDDDPAEFEDAYDAVLTSRTQSALYREVPVVYMWDDHDYGANNSDGTSPARRAARSTYRRYVPHYPLPAGTGDAPIYQSFRVGRVYFIVTDGRSERSPRENPDDAAKTMLGAEQKRWLERELLHAAETAPLVVWLQGVPWIGSPDAGADAWWGYSTERRELANFIADHRIRNLLMLSGDVHMVAIDDGRSTRYADDGSPGFPVFHAAPLDQGNSVRGGPYSEGISTVRGQYGLVEIVDDGGETVTVRLTGKTAAGRTVLSHAFSPPADDTRIAARPTADTSGTGASPR